MNQTSSHFKGKDALEHLVDARMKGKGATEETHGLELAGHLFAGLDAAKEMALFGFLWMALLSEIAPPSKVLPFTGLFAFLFLVWKFGRSSLLGWTRLHRLHRLIEEEKWEIEHHRSQERVELKAMYQAKGFSGKLLEEVLDVLMADDNRLLQVMLEEELGLKLESFEHPLKQGIGAIVGVIISSLFLGAGFLIHPLYGTGVAVLIVVAFTAAYSATKEKNRPMPFVVWNLSLALLVIFLSVFLKELL